VPRNRPFTAFVSAVFDVVDYYKLTERAARISDFDIYSLTDKLHRVAQYAGYQLDTMYPAHNGVPIKGKDLRAPKWPFDWRICPAGRARNDRRVSRRRPSSAA
jgi:hypothetical protein